MSDLLTPFVHASLEVKYQKLEALGCCYLLKKGGLTPLESPIEQEEINAGRAVLMALRLEAIKNFAKEKGLSPEVVEGMTKSSPLLDEDGQPVIKDGVAQTQAELSFQPMFYLDKAQCQEMISIQDILSSEPYLAATNAIKYRLLPHVEAVTASKAGRVSVRLSPFAHISEGYSLLGTVNGHRHKVKSVSEKDTAGCCDLLLETSSNAIASDEHFILLGTSGQPIAGVSGWTVEKTREALIESQINALYGFMLVERSGIDDEPEELGNAKPTLTSESSDSIEPAEESP